MGHTLNVHRFFLCVLLAAFVWGSTDAEVAPRKTCGLNKECVPRYLCDNNNNIIIDGYSLIDFRSGGNSCDWLEKCCSVADQKKDVESDYEPRGCGYANPQGAGINLKNPQRSESQFGEFPWTVLVLDKACCGHNCDRSSLGGGSLLAPNVVLTAAHIIFRNDLEILVRAGEWDTRSVGEPLRHEDRDVTTTIIHENYNNSTAFNDIALLILDSPFKLAQHIGTICLPNPAIQIDETNCVSTGWGKKEITNDYYPHIMKKVQLPLVDHSRCQRMLRANRVGPYFRLHSSFMCAGGIKGKDTCTGDGGGPLVCPLTSEPNRYQLVGAVSWGLSCNDDNVPGVYLNVTVQKAWIVAQLEVHSIVI